jgi:hypothetical protein
VLPKQPQKSVRLAPKRCRDVNSESANSGKPLHGRLMFVACFRVASCLMPAHSRRQASVKSGTYVPGLLGDDVGDNPFL